jgi:hypothetical protein
MNQWIVKYNTYRSRIASQTAPCSQVGFARASSGLWVIREAGESEGRPRVGGDAPREAGESEGRLQVGGDAPREAGE